MTKDEVVGWHHQLSGHEFKQAPGDGEGQGSLVCCSPWGHEESDTTEQQQLPQSILHHYLYTQPRPTPSLCNYIFIFSLSFPLPSLFPSLTLIYIYKNFPLPYSFVEHAIKHR